MKFFANITPISKLTKKLEKATNEMMAGGIEATQQSTLLVHETAIKLVNDNSDGTAQIRYKPKRAVVVSKPGDPPNTDTGRLKQSIKFDFKQGGRVGRVGTNLRYGAYLEFGTQDMEPRPWLSTALDLTKEAVADIFKKTLNGYIKRLGR